MKLIIKLTYVVAMFLLSATCFAENTPDNNKVDYYWIVDVSGQNNIYMEGIQHSIDTFYVEASKNDNLHVYNFAKRLIEPTETVDKDFFDYSDFTSMLFSLDSILKQSQSQYVRVFILSDFFNVSPKFGATPIDVDTLAEVSGLFSNLQTTKDLRFFMLELPPSSPFGGSSIDELKNILPHDTKLFAVTPDDNTTNFLLGEINAVNELRGMKVEEEVSSPIASYIILSIFVLAIIGAGAYFLWKKKGEKKGK